MSLFNTGLNGYSGSIGNSRKPFIKSASISESQHSPDSGLMERVLPDLVCLSHLRWDFVYQRPQHLLTRCATQRRTFFIEEPKYEANASWRLEISQRDCGIWVVVPHLPSGMSQEMTATMMQTLIDELFTDYGISKPILWYYTPIALSFTNHLDPLCIVYDCMDELSAFKGASNALKDWETELFKRADVVFTGGQSLYEAKQHQHPNVHAFPSSIDAAHFAQAKSITVDPQDQAGIAHPRLGFYGVIDERMNLELVDRIAQARPDWQLVLIGPVAKIDPGSLPCRPNIHYLGSKSYQELPHYLAHWDVALLPFALNESTRFISPTKTPEYLAAGKPVVSTSIRDVVRPYGEAGLVHIADRAEEFIDQVELAMQQGQPEHVEDFLAKISWDQTWEAMMQQIDAVILNSRRTSNV
ncbi:glycosyltransferase family 1 protein [Leptolyngbya sp. DQ-M1]|uniref:glycosyltransferase family 1 protein n=1 Tax=Leptolyngbya sp. DQ-M1 TaxID=2933920 RepID=UPI0032989FBB